MASVPKYGQTNTAGPPQVSPDFAFPRISEQAHPELYEAWRRRKPGAQAVVVPGVRDGRRGYWVVGAAPIPPSVYAPRHRSTEQLYRDLPPEQRGYEFGQPPGGPDTLRGKLGQFLGSPVGKVAQAAPFAVTGGLIGAAAGGPVGAAVGAGLGLAAGYGLNAYAQAEMERLSAAYGLAEAQRRFDEQTVVGRLLNWLDVPRQAFEQGLGLAGQFGGAALEPGKYGSLAEVTRDWRAAWNAARLTYESAPIGWGRFGGETTWVDYDLPETTGGLSALVEARRRIARGEDAYAVRAEIAARFGAPGQLRELASGFVADPLNLVGVAETKGGAAVARAVGAADAARAIERGRGLVGGYQAYRNFLVAQKALRQGLEVGQDLNRLQAWIIGKNLLNLGREGTYTRPTGIRSLWSLTPEAEAKEAVFTFSNNVQAYLSGLDWTDPDTPARAAAMVDAWKHAPTTAPERFPESGNIPLTVEGRVYQRALAAEAVKDLSDAYAATADYRAAFDEMARVLPDTPRAEILRRAGEEPDALIEQLRATGDPAIVKALDDGTLTARTLGEMHGTFVTDGVPHDPATFRAALFSTLVEGAAKWANDVFKPQAPGFVQKWAAAAKSVESVALLGFSVSYPMRNFINGELTMAARGVWGLHSLQAVLRDLRHLGVGAITEDLERMGLSPARLRQGITAAGLEGEAPGIPHWGEASAKAGLDVLAEATSYEGTLRRVQDLASKLTDRLPPTRIARGVERWQSARAYYEGFMQMWGQVWRRGAGIPRLPGALEAALRDIDPRLPPALYGAAESGLHPQEIAKQIFADVREMRVEQYADDAARALGVDEGLVRRVLAQDGLGRRLNRELAQAKTRAQVAQAFEGVRGNVERTLSEMAARDVADLAEHAAARARAEGPTALLESYQSLEERLLETHAKNIYHWHQRTAEIRRAPAEYRSALWRAAFRESDAIWTRYWDFFESQHAALGEGLERAGLTLDPRYAEAVAGHRQAVADFLAARQTALRAFFDDAGLKGAERDAEWARVQAALNGLYDDLAAAQYGDRGLQARMDDYLVAVLRQNAGPEYAEAVRAWREAVRKLNAQDMRAVQRFRQELERPGRTGTHNEDWLRFQAERLKARRDIAEQSINGLRAMYGKETWQAPLESPVPSLASRAASVKAAEAGIPIGRASVEVDRGRVQELMDQGLSREAAVRQAGGRTVRVEAPDTPAGRTNAARALAAEQGIATVSRAGVPFDDHLLNALNKADYRTDLAADTAPFTAEELTAGLSPERLVEARTILARRAEVKGRQMPLPEGVSAETAAAEAAAVERAQAAAQAEVAAAKLTETPPPPVEIMTREALQATLAEVFPDVTPKQLDAAMALLDARAEVWARHTGRPAGEYFGAHFAPPERGLPPGTEALYQLSPADGAVVRFERAETALDRATADRFPAATRDAIRARAREGQPPDPEWRLTPDDRMLMAELRGAYGDVDWLNRTGQALTWDTYRDFLAFRSSGVVRGRVSVERRAARDVRVRYMALKQDGLGWVERVFDSPERAEAFARALRERREYLYQSAKGAVEFLDDGRAIVRALEQPDISTVVHEIGHVFRRDLYHTATEAIDPLARRQLEADVRALEDWAGAKAGEWTAEAEERFARGFENYLAGGRAPSVELANVFERFKRWLLAIYRQLTGSDIDVALTPEVRGALDRMLAESPDAEAVKDLRAAMVGPRHELPASLSENMAHAAREMLDALVSGEPGRRVPVPEGQPGEMFGIASSYPEWYGRLVEKYGTHKGQVIAGLEKIVADQGQDTGTTVRRLKTVILERLAEGLEYYSTKLPPDPDALRLLGRPVEEIDTARAAWQALQSQAPSPTSLSENDILAEAWSAAIAEYVATREQPEVVARVAEIGEDAYVEARVAEIAAEIRKSQVPSPESRLAPPEFGAAPARAGQVGMFAATGEDLPLFSGTAPRAEASPFNLRPRMGQPGGTLEPKRLLQAAPEGVDDALARLPGANEPFDLPNGKRATLAGRDEATGDLLVRDEDGVIHRFSARDALAFLPAGVVDQLAGGAPVPYAQATEDAWYSWVLPVLDELQRRAEADVGTPAMAGHRALPPDLRVGVADWFRDVQRAMADSKLAAMKWGEFKRDAALLNYSRRYGYNTWLGMVAPYEFWMTQSMLKWALHSIDRPGWLAAYYRIAKFLNTEVQRPGFPSRLAGKVKIPLPFLPEWMGGGLWVDPLTMGLPFEQWAYPWEQNQYRTLQLDSRAERQLENLLAEGKISQAEYSQAMTARAGSAWERAKSLALADDKNLRFDGLDLAVTLVSPHVPLAAAYQAARGTPERIQPLPMTRQFRAVTAALGLGGASGWNLEGGLRRLAGLPVLDQWADYRIDRELANMAAEGLISPEEARAAMIERAGPMFEQAARREAAASGYGTVEEIGGAGVLGLALVKGAAGGDYYAPGEERARVLKAFYNAAWEAEENGDTRALERFYDEFPEYAARTALMDEPEERLRKFLVDAVWRGWFGLPELYRRQVAEAFGPTFEQAFLDDATRSYDSIPPETLAAWARTLGRYVPANVTGPALPMEWAPPEVARDYQEYRAVYARLFPPELRALQTYYFTIPKGERVEAYAPPDVEEYYRQREAQFGDLGAKWDGYFALPPGSPARRAYWAGHPELKASLDFRDAYYAGHPGVREWIETHPRTISARRALLAAHPELLQAWAAKHGWLDAHPWMKPYVGIEPEGEADPAAAKGPDILGDPALVRLAGAHLFAGYDLTPAARGRLEAAWKAQGEPGGSLERWLVQVLAFGGRLEAEP